ncbi:MAG TPA: ABC transporter permease [Chthoniobacterales bacterium]
MNDIRFAFRKLRQSLGFSSAAILTLGLGIGATTAIFSLVNGVLLRPLPYAEADRIIYLAGENREHGISDSNVSVLDFQDWQNHSQAFAKMALFWSGGAAFAAGAGEPERVPRAGVTRDFFDVIGVQPMLGRAFLAEEEQSQEIRVAILGERLWQRRFGSDRDIIGKTITINAQPVTVIGVMPAGFDFPFDSEVWTPAGIDMAQERRDNRSYFALGRLKSGVDLKQAQIQFSALSQQLAQAFPETNKGWDTKLTPLRDRLVRSVRPSLLVLLGAVVLVLLIACANIANLLLARAAARQKEVAIRSALGASGARILRQMLTESIVLSIFGGGLGVLLSVWLTQVLISISPPDSPRFGEVSLDYRVLGFAIALSVLTGILFGLAPALQASRLNVTSSLNEGGRGGDSYRRTRARSLLLIGEVALSLMLLFGAGLLIKSFLELQSVRPGFNKERVLLASISLPRAKYKEDRQRVEFFRALTTRLQTLPGVEAAGGGLNLPLAASKYVIGRAFIPEGRPMTTDEAVDANYSAVTPGYFEALQIPLLLGRAFNEHDNEDAPKVVIINRTAAIKHFGSEAAAIGKRITIWRDEKFAREIVGVVGDVKPVALEDKGAAQIYTPHAQDGVGFLALTIRTVREPAAMTATLRREVANLDKDLPIFDVRTMDAVVAQSIGSRRVSMLLFSVFAGAALLLAAIGIYGVIAYTVTQRTHEIGIRMALGAQAGDVLGMVVREGMTLTMIGVGVGLLGAFALAKVIASLLFGVGATDLSTMFAVILILSAVAFLACLLPARRATLVNPVQALRAE